MSKREQRLLAGCVVVAMASIVAAGMAVVIAVFPSGNDGKDVSLVETISGWTDGLGGAPAADQTANSDESAPADGAEIAGTVKDRLEQARDVAHRDVAGLPALPLQEPPTRSVPDLGILFAATNPGVVSIRVRKAAGGMEMSAEGSGWIFDDTHIVTNRHVVEGASDVAVTFADGTQVAARIVATDDDTDLAVVAVDAIPAGARALPMVEDFDSLTVGEPVVAIGNPFGFANTITSGIISALGRAISSSPDSDIPSYNIPQMIQTDAAINPGNSGGPLLNMRGEVVGVNAQIRTTGEPANSGVGFAIPASVVSLVVPALIENGSYTWSFLGVQGGSVDLVIATANDLPDTRGAYISNVVAGGPSEGLLVGSTVAGGTTGQNGNRSLAARDVGGDVVVAVNGEPIASFEDLLTYVALKTRPGSEVTLTILRGGVEQDVKITVGSRPD